ncbi:MAG TPA: hypothetical protein DHV28_19370 [Ignavibacteriales bacterium]|nr:hypothetical protein [Ignavibacteriales bacterium]
MKVHKILDAVFSTRSNIAVLRVISKVNIGLSGREIAKQAGMSAPSSLEALTAMENLNLVKRERGGRDHFFYLNREHYIVEKIISPILNVERKYPDQIYSDIKKGLGRYASSLILFGSTAREEEEIESDLDICVVFKDAISKRKLEKIISDLRIELFKKYGVSFAPYYISEKDFEKRARLKKSPVDDIIKEGKLISGKSIRDIING